MAASKSSKQVPASGNRRPPNAGKGRPKGVPNKVNKEAREVVAEFARGYAPKFVGWIDRVAVTDPARAAELYLRALEYHIPKLTRSHITASGATLEELVQAAERIHQKPQSDLRPAIEAAPTPSTTYQRVDPPAPVQAEPAPAPVHVPADTAPRTSDQQPVVENPNREGLAADERTVADIRAKVQHPLFHNGYNPHDH